MYHHYHLDAPDFDERYAHWWATLRRWFPDYDSMSLDKRMVAVETINGLLGAL